MLVPLIALGMFAQTPPYVDPADRGSELLHRCQAAITIEVNKGDGASVADYQAAADCMAYIAGFNDGILETDTTSTRRIYCLDHSTTRERVYVYVTYMQENPQWLDYHKSVGLRLALADAYPCAAPDPDPSPVDDDSDSD